MQGSVYLTFLSLILISSVAGADEVPPVVIPILAGEEGGDLELPTPDMPSIAEVQESPQICAGDLCDSCAEWGLFGPLRSWWHHSAKPRLQESHWGYDEYFHERPLGSLVRANMQEQVFSGLVDQMVLYEYDFMAASGEHGAELNNRGLAQLRRLALMTEQTGRSIVIAKTPNNEQLDRSRRQFVMDQLVRFNVAVFPDLVVSARTPIVGIGAIGERHPANQVRWNVTYRNRLLEVENRGRQRLLRNVDFN